jgi:DNA polymerase type B, organellar and viral
MNGRWIRNNHTTRVPQRIVCLDCESNESVLHGRYPIYVHTWRCGSATFDRLVNGTSIRAERFRTETKEELWDWILSKTHKRERLWVFSHNLAFDLTIAGIWQLAQDKAITITRWLIDDPPVMVDATWHGRKIRMVCAKNYWPAGMDTMLDAMQLRNPPSPGIGAKNDKWLELCDIHVDCVRRFMLRWIDLVKYYDLGNFRATIASQAMATYTHRFKHFPILQHGDKEFAKVERAAYFGGRCMVGYVGNCSAITHHYDVNSLYPYVMSQSEFPTEPINRADDISPDTLRECMDRSAAVAEVRIDSDFGVYPVRKNGRSYYANGRFNTTLCGDELQQALDRRHVRSVARAMLYRRRPIFEHWCNDWCSVMLDAKRDGDQPLATICKLLMNSLSGKWAQKNSAWVPANDLHVENDYCHWWYKRHATNQLYECRAVAGCVQKREQKEDEFGGLVAISAYITSAGRSHMDYLKGIAASGKIYYQDTDSLIIDSRAAVRLRNAGWVSKTRIGAMKHVCDYSHLQIDGPRRWSGDDKTIHAGIRTDAELVADGTYLQDTQQGARSILSTYPGERVLVEKERKTFHELELGAVPGDNGFCRAITFDD